MLQLYTLCQSQCRRRCDANCPWPLSLLDLCITKLGSGWGRACPPKNKGKKKIISSLKVEPAQGRARVLLVGVFSWATRTVGKAQAGSSTYDRYCRVGSRPSRVHIAVWTSSHGLSTIKKWRVKLKARRREDFFGWFTACLLAPRASDGLFQPF